MMSRSSSSKGPVRDGVRRSLWAVVLSTLAFVVSMLLPSLMNMQQALDVLIPLNIRQIHLLPFHQYGEPKYRLLGKTWSMKEVPAPSSADVATMREMAERAGLQVTVGG